LPEHQVAEATVRRYVRERKRELGWATRVTCVPQSYAPGQEGRADWYEAWAELSGEPVKLQVFPLRSMVSGAAFHRAYQRATQQAFLDAHEHALHYFGGVFRLLRYDNLKSAVKQMLRGHCHHHLPFSEWTSVIPNARLCKALIDRITDRANIIETGTESYRFRRTLENRKGKGVETKI
jgi:hypothetical protein